MNCERAQAAISARMDGEHLGRRLGAAVEHHVAGCTRCTAFETRAHAIRSSVRIRAAEDIPDLTERIMAAVGKDGHPSVRVLPRKEPRPAPKDAARTRRYAPAAAALVVGLLVGSIAVGGPWQHTGGSNAATAAQVVSGVRDAARSVRAYHATFSITERGLPGIDTRDFTMDVWFRAPTRYRLDVVDHTAYPSGNWHPTHVTFIANGSSTYRVGPRPCPYTLGVSMCARTSEVTRSRADFSSATPLAADLITPLDVLGTTHGVDVSGTGTVLGHQAVRLELPFSRAEPLFPFLQLGGTWRPFYPGDTVTLWLDRSNWFPLRYTVTPSADPERRLWSLRFGLPEESPTEPILDVSATAIESVVPPGRRFSIPGTSVTREVPVTDLKHVASYEPVQPTTTADLPLTSAVVPTAKAVSLTTPQTLLTYSSGLTYLRVGERRNWQAPMLFGPVGEEARRLTLPSGSVVYYVPATDEHGQQLAIHATDTNLYLETNLSSQALLQVAESIPVVGTAVPAKWLTTRGPQGFTRLVSLERATATLPFSPGVPTDLPQGYVLQTVELTRVGNARGVNLDYVASDGTGAPIRVHEEAGSSLPTTSVTGQSLDVAGAPGRWTPLADKSTGASRLEWVRTGVYYSIDEVGLALDDVIAIASSIPVRG